VITPEGSRPRPRGSGRRRLSPSCEPLRRPMAQSDDRRRLSAMSGSVGARVRSPLGDRPHDWRTRPGSAQRAGRQAHACSSKALWDGDVRVDRQSPRRLRLRTEAR
jgi:hypothetical protein